MKQFFFLLEGAGWILLVCFVGNGKGETNELVATYIIVNL
jgi:hypothetical protein